MMSAIVSKEPVVLSQGVSSGKYYWVVQMPIIVTFDSASEQLQRNFIVTMKITRVHDLSAPGGILIENLLSTSQNLTRKRERVVTENEIKQETTTDNGLEYVMLRNSFYQDHYRYAVLALLLLLVINGLLVVGIGYKLTHPPQSQYFAMTPDGRIINAHALTDPVQTDDFVLQWTADNVRQAFSQDYLHYRWQLQQVADSFTPNGWHDFLSSMQKSNNLKTLVSLKMVSDATITKSPVITEKMVVGGHYAWKIQMSILLSYSNVNKSIPTPLNVTVIVLREPVKKLSKSYCY